MPTRKKKKYLLDELKLIEIQERARIRRIGQKMKDTLYTSSIISKDYQHNRDGLTRKERKIVNKIKKRMGEKNV